MKGGVSMGFTELSWERKRVAIIGQKGPKGRSFFARFEYTNIVGNRPCPVKWRGLWERVL